MFCKSGGVDLRGRIFVPGVPACVPENGKDAECEHAIMVLPEQNVSTIEIITESKEEKYEYIKC